MSFADTVDTLFTVYAQADKDLNILSQDLLPVDFFENDANNIIPSYLEYINNTPEFQKTSLASKHQQKKYTSAYALFHDLKVACSSGLSQLMVGSTQYKNIDFFYKFSVELLLREASKVGASIDLESEPLSIELQLAEDFQKISYHYSASNGEALIYINETEEPVNPGLSSSYMLPQVPEKKIVKQAVFSSLVGKSSVDSRKTLVPDPYNLSKVVPITKSVTNNTQSLKNVSQPSPRIPPPGSQPSKLLDSFFHPNWYTIDAPKWISYSQAVERPPLQSNFLTSASKGATYAIRTSDYVRSFAPVSDSKQAVLPESIGNLVWLSHMGAKEIEAIKKKYFDKKEEVAKDKVDEKKEVKADIEEPKKEEVAEPKSNVINVAHLSQYKPEEIATFKELFEEKILSPRDLQRLISVNLLKLNKLRQKRYLNSSAGQSSKPSSEEKALYKRIEKLLALILDLKNNADPLTLEFSKKIAVLLNEYSGTLPALVPSANANARLQIRGLQKRR